MTKPNKIIPISDASIKAGIDPESIEVVAQILEDLKRKVSDAEELLRIMRQQHS